MDAIILDLSLISFLGLIVSWLVLPSSAKHAGVPHPTTVPA